MRNIARYAKVHVTAVTINAYQVERCRALTNIRRYLIAYNSSIGDA